MVHNGKKLHLLLFYVFIATIIPIATYAQELQVKSFELLNRDITARTKRVDDSNGQMCALVRVSLPVENCKFVGNVIHQSFDVNEYLVYMPDKSKQLQVECPGFKALQIELTTADGIVGVESGRTYRLELYGYGEDNTNLVRYDSFSMENNGVAEAQFSVGVSYEAKQDYKEAVKNYRKAAEQGYAPAQVNLGNCFFKGQGVNQDYKEAVSWYRKAAEQGQSMGQYNLGICYFQGQGVNQDYKEAVSWYRKAAEQGHAEAQNGLGGCYFNGQGVNQDYKEAVSWFRKAAEQGETMAQCNLGICYLQGQGVSQNDAEAAKWLRKSAKQGNTMAIDLYKELKSIRRKAILGGISFSIKK